MASPTVTPKNVSAQMLPSSRPADQAPAHLRTASGWPGREQSNGQRQRQNHPARVRTSGKTGDRHEDDDAGHSGQRQ